MDIKIERMKKGDISNVIEFHNRYLGEKSFVNEKELEKRLDNNTGIFLLAKNSKNDIVGIKLGYIQDNICIGRGIAVRKEYRRRGIGKMLLKEFNTLLNGYTDVREYIFASGTNEGIPFHIGMGYIPNVLVQFKEKDMGRDINPKGYVKGDMEYNGEFGVYQLLLFPKGRDINISSLRDLELLYPDLDILFIFKKVLRV